MLRNRSTGGKYTRPHEIETQSREKWACSHFPAKVFNPAFTTARHRHPASKQINHESVNEDNLIRCITLRLNGPFAAATSTILFTDRRTRQIGAPLLPLTSLEIYTIFVCKDLFSSHVNTFSLYITLKKKRNKNLRLTGSAIFYIYESSRSWCLPFDHP